MGPLAGRILQTYIYCFASKTISRSLLICHSIGPDNKYLVLSGGLYLQVPWKSVWIACGIAKGTQSGLRKSIQQLALCQTKIASPVIVIVIVAVKWSK